MSIKRVRRRERFLPVASMLVADIHRLLSPLQVILLVIHYTLHIMLFDVSRMCVTTALLRFLVTDSGFSKGGWRGERRAVRV